MPSSSFFSGTNPTPTEYENAVDLVAQASAQATAALASQTAAATSAQSAQGYSVSAGTSAETATQQAAAAATSAAGALASQNAAAASATAASSSATSASSSASNAATSATNASNSATSASGSATSAGTYATNAANSATAAANSASDAAATLANALVKTNNLSDLSNATTARSNLGVAIGSNVQAWDADLDAIAAISSTSGLLKKTAANTWSLDTTSYHSGTLGLSQGGTGATDAAGARTALGLGTAATAAATSFAQVANNLSDLVSASSARINLGLGSVATLASSAVLQSANNLSDLGNVTTARSSLGLGSLATLSSVNNSNWSGTQLSVANGGTGLTSLTASRIPYASATDTLGTSANLTFDGGSLYVGQGGSNQVVATNDGSLEIARAAGGPYIDMKAATASDYDCRIQSVGSGSTAYLQIKTGQGTGSFDFSYSGNLGLGVTPNYKLHVYGGNFKLDSAAASAFFLLSNNSGTSEFGTDSSGLYIQAPTSKSTRFYVGGAQAMTLDASGRLGIGTANLFAKSTIISNGAPSASGQMSTGAVVAISDGGEAINIGATQTYAWINAGYNNNSGVAIPLDFFVGADRKARITSSGNFLVGTTSSWIGKLQVKADPSAQWNLDCTDTQAAIANGGSYALAAGSGLIIVSNYTNGSTAIYTVGGAGVVKVGGGDGWDVATSTPASGKLSIAYNAGTGKYTVYNNYGSTVTVGFAMIASRQYS